MKETTPHRVQLLQGNATVRRLMVEALEASGFELSDDAEAADLLVVDVDSGLDTTEAQQQSWADAERPVLLCGVRNSREHFPEVPWMHRPFSPDGFVAECRHMLGIAETPGLEEDSTPQTQRLTVDDAERLERELGLEKGTLDLSDEDSEGELDLSLEDTNNLGGDDIPEFAELESSKSIELDVDDLEEVDEVSSGGARVGGLEREAVSVEALEWSTPVAAPPEAPRRATLNQTMPDAPAVMAPKDLVDEDSAPRGLSPSTGGEPLASPPRQGSQAHSKAMLERQIDDVAHLLAQSWGRIGLAARSRDRANHIRGVLRSQFTEGTAAAADEIERIPDANGFSGSLAALGLDDILSTVGARRLRGRLELAVGADDFVLYLDGGCLIDLENISGSDDRLLLDILLERGAIAQQIYEDLERTLADELAVPVQMQLRQGELVSPHDLVDAREERIIRLCRNLLTCRQGSFAFVAVEEGAGQAWPVDGLSIDIADLLADAECESSDNSAAVESSARGSDEVFFPEGLEIDDHLTPTVEVTDPDSDL